LKWFLGSGQLESATQPQDSNDEALEYARRLYLNLLDWYRIADFKGQLLLTLNGAFVTIMTGFVWASPPRSATKYSSSARRYGFSWSSQHWQFIVYLLCGNVSLVTIRVR
jgi:hypothetical protein